MGKQINLGHHFLLEVLIADKLHVTKIKQPQTPNDSPEKRLRLDIVECLVRNACLATTPEVRAISDLQSTSCRAYFAVLIAGIERRLAISRVCCCCECDHNTSLYNMASNWCCSGIRTEFTVVKAESQSWRRSFRKRKSHREKWQN